MWKAFSLAVALLTALSGGCNSGMSDEEFQHAMRVGFVPDAQDVHEPVAVHILSPQAEPMLFYPRPDYFGPTAIAFTAGLAFWMNAVTYLASQPDAQAQQVVRPLAGMGLGSGFTMQSQAALRHCVDSSNWLKVRSVDTIPSTNVDEEAKKTSLLQIELTHGLSLDGSMFALQAKVYYCRLEGVGDSTVSAFTICYCSSPVQKDSTEDAVAWWAVDNGSRYRHAADEGIAEISRILQNRFLNRPPSPPDSAREIPEIPLRIVDPYSRDIGTYPSNYFILRRDGERVTAKSRQTGEIYNAIPLPDDDR